MDGIINIAGADKAAILAALYNASRVQGLGWLQSKPGDMTIEEARELLAQPRRPYFDYLHGRVMKIDLSTDELRPWLYDRDLGKGACLRAIEHLLPKEGDHAPR